MVTELLLVWKLLPKGHPCLSRSALVAHSYLLKPARPASEFCT